LKENISFPVNAKITPIAYVFRLFLHLNSRQALHHVGFFKGKLRSQTVFEVPPDCFCTSENTTWRTASLMQNLRQLFLLDPILRRFRIVRCNRQAALHSAMNNYTPLVIGGVDKNKQLTIVKPTQTGINRNK
jgi:hypothetical protein